MSFDPSRVQIVPTGFGPDKRKRAARSDSESPEPDHPPKKGRPAPQPAMAAKKSHHPDDIYRVPRKDVKDNGMTKTKVSVPFVLLALRRGGSPHLASL